MPLSRNQIRKNATAFAAAWKDETSESGEAKSFWDGKLDQFDRLDRLRSPRRGASRP